VKIYQVNLDDRLGRHFDPIPGDAEIVTKHFLVVHPKDADRSVSIDLPGWLNNPNCSGILYVKGVPNAGLSKEQAREIERENKQRVHFLSYSIGDRDDLEGALGKRFSHFFEEVENQDNINWELIDEPWPENLLALYLLAKTLASLNSDDANLLIANKDGWTPLWREAKKEYCLRASYDLDYAALDVDNASNVAGSLMSCFEGLS